MSDWRKCLVGDDAGLTAILRDAKTVAVVGAKDDPDEPAHYVPAYLHARGYRISERLEIESREGRPVPPKIVYWPRPSERKMILDEIAGALRAREIGG